MNKSALVLETPKNCFECPFSCEWFGDPAYEACCELYGNLRVEEEALITEEYYDYESKEKPDWCPLKPLPEKKETSKIASDYAVGYAKGYEKGWSDCFDEITGENGK